MWTEIGIVAYLAVGCFNLYKTVQILTNEEVQKSSKTVQQIWTIYQMNPTFVLIGLFVMNCLFWLPLLIVMSFGRSKDERKEMKEEVDMIHKNLNKEE